MSAFCLQSSVLDESIAESACIVADTDKWWVLSCTMLFQYMFKKTKPCGVCLLDRSLVRDNDCEI